MEKSSNPLYSATVIEFVAAANEFCKYADRAGDLKGKELLSILQRILPFIYLKASFVTEDDWSRVNATFRNRFGSADDYLEVFDDRMKDSDSPITATISENMADIYQDLKDFIILYQTGTEEVMNDALWECRLSFENQWGQKLVNSLRAIHSALYSGEEIVHGSAPVKSESAEERDTSDWIISKRQKDYRGE
jgi:hypothetical protein